MYNDLDVVINSDPTLRFFLREAKLDIKSGNFDHQVNVMGTAIMIAINKNLHNKYPTR